MLHCGVMAWESESGMTTDLKNTRQAPVDFRWPGLTHPAGEPLRLNRGDFVAVDRDANAAFDEYLSDPARPLIIYGVTAHLKHLPQKVGAFLEFARQACL